MIFELYIEVIRLLYYLPMEMTKKEEKKSELEKISDLMDYVEYTLHTKDDIWAIKCRLYRERYSVVPEFKRTWNVIWKTKHIKSEDDGREILLWNTENPTQLEYCIEMMNEFIKDNFKTSLDNQTY